MLNFYIIYLLVSLPLMYGCYLFAERAKRADYADLIWVALVCSQGLISFSSSNNSPAVLLLNVMILIWGVKLGYYLFKRIVFGKKEDSRYAFYRESWGASASWKMPAIFMLQPVYSIFFALPIVLANYFDAQISIAGIIIWLTGMTGSFIADKQLSKFKLNSQHNEICQLGLWKYSRHPNYFF
jgi:steroid 5-alpha reductase family enzyme